VAEEEEEAEDDTEETTVEAVVDTATIVIATSAEDAGTISAREIGAAAVPRTTTTAGVGETTFAADAIDRPTGEALRDVVGTIAVAAADLGADRHHRVVTTAGTIAEEEEEAVTREVLLVGATKTAIGVATTIIETVAGTVVAAVADTTTSSVAVLKRCTVVETIVEETIVGIVIRGLSWAKLGWAGRVSNIYSRSIRDRISS